MRYAIDTIGPGERDPYWRWTLYGAVMCARKLGPAARVRRRRRGGRWETVIEPVRVQVDIRVVR